MQLMPTPIAITLSLSLFSASGSLAPLASIPAAESRQGTSLHVCTLLTKDEVEKYIAKGRRMYTPAEEGPFSCNYEGDMAQVLVFEGPKAEDDFNRFLAAFRKEKDQRYPVSGLGDDAWVMYPKPRDKYEATVAVVHAKVGRYVLVVSMAAEDGKTGESRKDDTVALAKLLTTKLR